MLTGINFSPPLYFLFNFCIQLVFPTSIEHLRIQSLVFIIIGILFSFLLTRKLFGSTSAFMGTILVASQSNLLLSQAQEARHYAMFFAFGAWVLYVQSLNNDEVKRYKWLTFLAHFCLCQAHYLGIIFSFLSGVAYFLTCMNKRLWKRIPMPIALCWLVSIISYLFYLTRQKSVLNTWSKANELSDLLAGYNESLIILTILIPVLPLILTNKKNRNTEKISIKKTNCSKIILLTSLLWLSLPLIFWMISRISSLNLFVDRYFIPKEAAVIFIVGCGLSFFFQKLPQQKSESIPKLGSIALAIMSLIISTKRATFGLNKNTNYHHSLIIEQLYPKSEQPIILEADPMYFPNAYLNRNEYLFLIKDDNMIKTYNQFSKKVNISGS